MNKLKVIKMEKQDCKKKITLDKCVVKDTIAVISSIRGISISKKTKFLITDDQQNHKKVLEATERDIKYESRTNNEDENDYYIGIYDIKSQKLKFILVPFFFLRLKTKEKRKFSSLENKKDQKELSQRAILSEAFGNKKVKTKLSNIEKNKIDFNELENDKISIMESVNESSVFNHTKEEELKKVDNTRPVPQPNLNASKVEDIYPLENIINSSEFFLLDIDKIRSESGDTSYEKLFPFYKDGYILKNLQKNCLENDKKKKQFQLLYYASLLYGIYENRRIKKKTSLANMLNNKTPKELIFLTLSKFSISQDTSADASNSSDFVIDPFNEDKLLCFLFTILFHLNNFVLELQPLAYELSLKPTKLLSLLRAMGSVVKPATSVQLKALNIVNHLSSSYKIATLKIPFKLPALYRKRFK